MKEGKSLHQLVQELERQLTNKRDFKAPAGRLGMFFDEDEIRFDLNGIGNFGVNDTAHEQIGEYLEIPKRYYDKMKANSPSLLSTNVNLWLSRKQGEQRLIRTLDGNVRALLSDRYRQLDNYDLLQAVLPVITQDDEFEIKSCDVTERRLYLQVVNKAITTNVKAGDTVQAGIVISNSEIGDGSLRIEPMVYRLVCTNGMIRGEAIRKYHVGRAGQGDLDNAIEFFRDETRQADDKAFFMKVQDAVRGAFDETRFLALVQQMQKAADDQFPVSTDLPVIIEVAANRWGFSELEQKTVQGHFLRGGDFSRYGLLNAVTRTAQDMESYDRAIEFERFGGDILALSSRELIPVAHRG